MPQSVGGEPRFDAERLLALARQRSRESRSRLATLVIAMFDCPEQAINERERSLIYRILHDIVHDIEMSARRAISTHLAGRKDVPRDLIATLANDKIEVAYPVLVQSELLRDEDLIEIIRFRGLEHQLAIASRHKIGESVCAELAGTGTESVVVALLKNKSAKIAGHTMEYLVEQSQRVNAYREPILLRKEIAPELAKRMFAWVSLALREYIVANFPIPRQDVDDLIERVIAVETERLNDERALPGKKSTALAEAMEKDGLITPDMLVAALRESEFPLFVAMFGRMTGLRDDLIMRVTFEPGGERLAIASQAVGIGKVTFATLYSLAHRSPPAGAESLTAGLALALEFFDSFTADAAREVVRQWRRDADYLNAIRQFTQARTKPSA